jgi:Cof subfamily protein (haloacid dehalogenase superfamily)
VTDRRIAFLDVDGTMLEAGERIAESTIEAVRTARANGHLVYVSTGRATVEIPSVVADIGFDGVISAGGGFAEIDGELVLSQTLPPDAVARMVAYFERAGDDFYLQSYDEIFPSPGVYGRYRAYLEAHLTRRADGEPDVVLVDEHPGLKKFKEVRGYPDTGVAKGVFIGADQTAYERVAEELGDEFHVITGTIPHLGRGGGEVTYRGVNKGTAIAHVLERLGIDVAASIGIGDGGNDVEMLAFCGVGIAMGNATDEIKAHADEVTTDVLDDGVWNAFIKHGLV